MPLDLPPPPGYGEPMRLFWRNALCVILAFAVFAILISPLVPSPPTTLRGKHAPHVLQVAALIQASLQSGWLGSGSLHWLVMEGAPARSGRQVVALTTARLC